MANNVKLNCLVSSEKSTFSVVISMCETVEDLQKAIQAEKRAFWEVDPNLLELHKVSILPVNRIRSLSELGLVDKDPLVATDELSDVFKEAPEPKHVHIVVVKPPPTAESELKLNCWVINEERDCIFPIEIARTRTVGALKNAIKDKRKREFEDVDANTLVLWKVDVEKNKRFEELKLDDGVDGVQKLGGFDEISVVFPGPARKYIVAVEPLTALPAPDLNRYSVIGSFKRPFPDGTLLPPLKRRRINRVAGSQTIYRSESDPGQDRPALPIGSNFDQYLSTPDIIFADKTMYIEELDKEQQYQYIFLRPRRWGKSTFLQLLANYYDKSKAEAFDDTFGHLYIGKHPTPDRSSLLVLLFDFSTIGAYERAEFHDILNASLSRFLVRYSKILGNPAPSLYIEKDFALSLSSVLNLVKSKGEKLFVGVDEYDAPANPYFSSGDSRSEQSWDKAADLFRTKFFATIKQEIGSVVQKYWLTGVLPVFREGISPLLNMKDISHWDTFNGLCGLTEEEVESIASEYLGPSYSPDALRGLMEELKRWYNGYRFSHNARCTLYNPQLVFDHIVNLRNYFTARPFEDHSANHIASVLATIGTNSQFHFVDFFLDALSGKLQRNVLREFGAKEVKQIGERRDITLTILYHFGVLTYSEQDTTLSVPNMTMVRLITERLRCFMERQSFLRNTSAESLHILVMRGNLAPLVQSLEHFFQSGCTRATRGSNKAALHALIESHWFETRQCVSELCLVVDPSVPHGNGRLGFADLFFPQIDERHSPASRVPIIELKNVTLDSIWKAETGGQGTLKELDQLRDTLKREQEYELLERKYTYWDLQSNTWRTRTIRDLQEESFGQIQKYLTAAKGGPANFSTAGICDDRVSLREGKDCLDGHVLMCIGGTRVLSWNVHTAETKFAFIISK